MRTDLLALRILKLLVVLYSKVLPFNLFFDLLSQVVASSWLDQALKDLFRINWNFGGFWAARRIEAVLKFVAQVVRPSILVNGVENVGVEISMLRSLMSDLVKRCSDVFRRLLFSSFLGPVPESNRYNLVFVWGISPPWIFIVQWRFIFSMNLVCVLQLVLCIDFIGRAVTLLANLIIGSFHKLMHPFVHFEMTGIQIQSLAVLMLNLGDIGSFVRKYFRFCRQVRSGRLVKLI